jgi:hypothetical protein
MSALGKADMCSAKRHVRFTRESRHCLAVRFEIKARCRLRAKWLLSVNILEAPLIVIPDGTLAMAPRC